jgi:hypothetical protein
LPQFTIDQTLLQDATALDPTLAYNPKLLRLSVICAAASVPLWMIIFVTAYALFA